MVDRSCGHFVSTTIHIHVYNMAVSKETDSRMRANLILDSSLVIESRNGGQVSTWKFFLEVEAIGLWQFDGTWIAERVHPIAPSRPSFEVRFRGDFD